MLPDYTNKAPWHKLGVEECMQKVKSSFEGLSSTEAAERLTLFGKNELKTGEGINPLRILINQIKSPLILILLAAAAGVLALGKIKDGLVIFFVLTINTIIGFTQEIKAERDVRSLKKMVSRKVRVVRDGVETETDASGLVPGDMVSLASGDRVPADLRLVRTTELKIEEAMLTGEPLPAEKNTRAIMEDNLPPGDRLNIAFMGTAVVTGRALGVVVSTGENTELGEIARNVTASPTTTTPLQEKFERLAKVMGLVTLVSCGIFLGVSLAFGKSLAEAFLVAVALAVAMIPEGLPVVVTIVMAVGVSRMARRNAVIRNLPAVETLGGATVICTDKTGTLTRNEMTVTTLYDGVHDYDVTGVGYAPQGRVEKDGREASLAEFPDLEKTLRLGVLCNESQLVQVDGAYAVRGDPTEGALIVAALKAGMSPERMNEEWPRLGIQPFESERGYMATLNRRGTETLLCIKGGLEKVMGHCLADGQDNCRLDDFSHRAKMMAAQGLRVLVMGEKRMGKDFAGELADKDIAGILPVGLAGILDPPRPEARTAIEGCKRAGVRVIMVTGDHAVTAGAIAADLGICPPGARTLTGVEVEKMDDESLFNALAEISVFARVAPMHKLRIVTQLLRRGEIVAVTGDGVNDAPAIKAAHIGVAMGVTGTDVARDTADMVLADDNFASIFAAVEEGRIVWDNIRKAAMYLLTGGLGIIVTILLCLAAGLPMPFSATQILWLNFVTSALMDVALAFERGEPGILEAPPRKTGEGVLSGTVMRRILLGGLTAAAGTLLIFSRSLEAGIPLVRAQTMAMTAIAFFQFFQVFNCRSIRQSIFRMSPFGNRFLFVCIALAMAAQMAVTFMPSLEGLIGTDALDVGEFARILLVCSSIVAVMEIDKFFSRIPEGKA